MVDNLSKADRSQQMARVKSRNTKPEILTRSLLSSLGFRYRLHQRGIPGRPDISNKRRRIAIFVHGCFWHRHDAAACKLARLPKSRVHFWQTKLEGNKARDEMVVADLKRAGWRVGVVWECELRDKRRTLEKLRRLVAGTI